MPNWFTQKNSVKGATSILVVTLTVSNILGLLRDHFLAQKVPADMLDTYYAAFRLPDLIFNTLILGAVSSAFIPIFSKYISNKDQEGAQKLASSTFTTGITLLILAVIALFFTMPYLIPLLVPDFSIEKQQATLNLSRLFLISPLFFGISYFFSAILNSYKRFFVSSLAPLVYNLSIIVATIGFADRYGIYSVAYGVIIGAVLHMLVQLLPVKNLGIRLHLLWDTTSSDIRKVGRLMIPRSIGLGAMQIMLFIFTAIASGLGVGAVAIFNLADNIQTMPTVVFGTSIASALFPTLAESYSLGKFNDFSRYLEKAMITILFFLVPATVGIILLRVQIVRLILGSGHFGWHETVLTAQTLGVFAISLVFSGLVPLFARAFYALQNTKTPTIYSVIGVIVSVIFGLFFSKYFGIAGLAFGFSIGIFVNFVLLYFAIKKHIPDFSSVTIISSLAKIIIATVAMALAIQIAKISVGTIYDLDRFVEVATQVGVSVGIGIAVYFSVTYFLGLNNIKFIKLGRLFGLQNDEEK